MRHFIITIIGLFVFQTGFTQGKKKSIYFPREKLVHPKCTNSIDKDVCLDSIIEGKLLLILNLEKSKRLFYDDTLNVSITFPVSNKGEIFEDFIGSNYHDDIINNRLDETTAYYIKQLPILEVKNRKPKSYISFHKFEYKYLINFNNNKSLTKLEIPYKYNGGIIREVPLFKDCERKDDYKDRICFSNKIKEHISRNFNYPEEAQEDNIQGVVQTYFMIGKDGVPFDFRAKGAHKLLQEEALRILSLLPKMEPGMINGEPVTVPYTIPITFTIQ